MLIAFIGLFKILRRMWSEPEFRALMLVEGLLLFAGMLFYHFVEGWSLLDSAYFCVVTMATVGYGDMYPQTTDGRFFTIFYIIFGVAMLGVFIQLVGKTTLESLQESVAHRHSDQSRS